MKELARGKKGLLDRKEGPAEVGHHNYRALIGCVLWAWVFSGG